MDPVEQISEEWSSLSGFYTAEEADFMSQLLGNCSLPENLCGNFNLGIPSAIWPCTVKCGRIRSQEVFPFVQCREEEKE